MMRQINATRKMTLIRGLTFTAITAEAIIMAGARTAMRIIIWKAFWTLVTSVVSRVTRPAVEYLSMLAKLKSWMFRNMAARRFAAKPEEAVAAVLPARMPARSPSAARPTISAP